MIEFDGISSDSLHLIVEHYPKRYFAKRRFEVKPVPGRNGQAIHDEGCFEDYTQPYSVFFDSKTPGLQLVARSVSEWLLHKPGYLRLEDSYEPDVYRMAYYNGGEEFLNHFNEYGRGTLTFSCAPQRFYKDGEFSVVLSKNKELLNPSLLDAYPVITLVGTGNVTFSMTKDGTTKQFAITDLAEESTVTIDTEKHKIYDSNGNNLNEKLTGLYEDMALGRKTSFTWSNGITEMSIIPRWWTI